MPHILADPRVKIRVGVRVNLQLVIFTAKSRLPIGRAAILIYLHVTNVLHVLQNGEF